MAMKLACADFTFPLLPHDKALDLIAMLEFQGVDIGLFEDRSHLWPSRVFADLGKNARELKDRLRSRGLEPADIFLQTALDFVSVAPNHPDAAVRKRSRELFLRTLEFTVECGGRHVSALPGVLFGEEGPEASRARCVEELAWRCAQATAGGLVFGVEPHLGSIAPNPAAAAALVRDTPGLTLTLDYTHFTKQGFGDAEIEPLIASASHFHARGAAKGRIQTIMKENTIDYVRVIRAMEEAGYPGFVGVEYTYNDWEDCNRTDNVSESIILRDLIRKAQGRT